MSVGIEVDGLDEFVASIDKLESLISPAALEERVIALAAQAGQLLLRASVQACVEAVYQNATTPKDPFGAFGDNAPDRSGDLLNSIELHGDGTLQVVEHNMDAPLSGDVHSGRETVGDYALAVHDGYTQWVPNGHGGSKNTGIFHPGRFYFDVAEQEAFPVIYSFVEVAFNEMIEEILAAI